MKKFKRLGAFLTALALSVSMLPSAFAVENAADWTAREKAEGTARFAVFSDSHLITDTKRLDLAFQSFSNIGGIDGVMMVGDIVYMNKKDVLYSERYELLNSTIGKYEAIKNLPIAYVMGNHEYPEGTTDATVSANSQTAFVEGIGLSTDRAGVVEVSGANAVYEMGGYTVVAASPEAYSNQMSAETEAWAKAKIEEALANEANAGEPVFYLQHQPIQNTVRSSSTAKNSAEFMTWIKSQPRVINFTAHCHYSAYDPKSIWQSEAGFTAIHSPLLGGGYLGGMVGSYERENITDAAYALMVEVDKNNVVTVHKLDLYNGDEAGAPYVIDVNSDERLYTDARFENANAPVFKNNEAVTVDEVTGSSVTVSFPDSAVMTQTTDGSNDGFVLYWRVEAINKETGKVSQYVNRYGDFWTKSGYETRTVKVSSLERNTEYTINVYPVSPFIVKGEPISVDIKTTNEKSEADLALISTKTLNVAAHKPVTASAPHSTYVPSNLTDDNRTTFVIPGVEDSADDDWFVVDLEKRYKVKSVELYDRYNQSDEGGRRYISIEGSNDPDFGTYDVLDSLGAQNDTLFPDNGCFTAEGNGNAYRYIRVRRTGGYYYGYSEIKVYADQDVTEVTRKKTAVADHVYSSATVSASTFAASKVVNGTISNNSDAWVTEQGSYYHFVNIDMESPKNIGLIEMYGRRGSTAATTAQRNNWTVYGSNEAYDADTEYSLLRGYDTVSAIDKAEGTTLSDKYKKILATKTNNDYISGEYIFPEYPAYLQQVVSDKEAYTYLTFKRNATGSTYLGEIRGYELNPMVNAITEANGVITVDFSDVMNADSLTNDNIKVYDGGTNTEIAANVEISADGYSAIVTPNVAAAFYKVVVMDDVVNQYGTDMAKDVEVITDPENLYDGFATKTDIYANVAMGKPVTSSGVGVVSGYPLSFMTDNCVGTQATYAADGVNLVGTARTTGSGWVQIDLQNRYNLELVQFIPRQDLTDKAYITNFTILASNDPEFKTYDTLDSIGSTDDETKLVAKGIWNIELDGTKDYRYIRINRTSANDAGIAEVRAYAKFDGISVRGNATADSYYYYRKVKGDKAYVAQKLLDGKTSTFFYMFNSAEGGNGKPSSYYGYIQFDFKKPYHIGYMELVARNSGHGGKGSYQHFDIFGSNVTSAVTDDNYSTHPYHTKKWLEDVDGYNKLYRSAGNAAYTSTHDTYWPYSAAAVYQMPLNDAEAYRYLTYKTNSKTVAFEMSEARFYAVAQRVNRVDIAEDGRITINFAAPLVKSSANEETISMVNEAGDAVNVSDVEIGEYTYSFMPASQYGTITVSKDVMNTYAVPMAKDFTVTFEEPEVLENLTFTVADADATALAASTEYTFAGTFNNNEETLANIYAIVAIYDQYGRLSKVECEPYTNIAAGGEQAVSVKITTDADVTGQTVYAYVLKSDFTPMWDKIDALLLNNN